MPAEKQFYHPVGGNEMPRFAGLATMMRLPAHADAKGLDACFVGVPLDIGTSNRSGDGADSSWNAFTPTTTSSPEAIRRCLRYASSAIACWM